MKVSKNIAFLLGENIPLKHALKNQKETNTKTINILALFIDFLFNFID